MNTPGLTKRQLRELLEAIQGQPDDLPVCIEIQDNLGNPIQARYACVIEGRYETSSTYWYGAFLVISGVPS